MKTNFWTLCALATGTVVLLASSASASVNVIGMVFKQDAKKVEKFAENAIRAVGDGKQTADGTYFASRDDFTKHTKSAMLSGVLPTDGTVDFDAMDDDKDGMLTSDELFVVIMQMARKKDLLKSVAEAGKHAHPNFDATHASQTLMAKVKDEKCPNSQPTPSGSINVRHMTACANDPSKCDSLLQCPATNGAAPPATGASPGNAVSIKKRGIMDMLSTLGKPLKGLAIFAMFAVLFVLALITAALWVAVVALGSTGVLGAVGAVGLGVAVATPVTILTFIVLAFCVTLVHSGGGSGDGGDSGAGNDYSGVQSTSKVHAD